jgi:hypothetical protein
MTATCPARGAVSGWLILDAGAIFIKTLAPSLEVVGSLNFLFVW